MLARTLLITGLCIIGLFFSGFFLYAIPAGSQPLASARAEAAVPVTTEKPAIETPASKTAAAKPLPASPASKPLLENKSGPVRLAPEQPAIKQLTLRPPVRVLPTKFTAVPKPPAVKYPRRVDPAYMDARANRLMAQLEMTGLAMALVENGEITFAKGYGEALRDSGLVVDENTAFRWASVSKGMAASTVLSLVEDGAFTLDTKAESLAPSLKLPPAETRIDLFNLLSHQIGITPNAYDRRIEASDSPQNARRDLSKLPYICPPASCHTYQNVAYDASSEIIERTTGRTYAQVLKDRVFGPLGMSTASATYDGFIGGTNWARPHSRFGKRISRVKPNYYRVPAAAGINSSVTDLAKWMIAQMPAYSPFPNDRLTEMQNPRVPTPKEQRFLNRRFHSLQNAHYGLGWRVYDYQGHKLVGHRGGVQGYRALALFDPEQNAGIAVMWNSPHTRPIGLQMEFMDALYGLPRRDWMDFGK